MPDPITPVSVTRESADGRRQLRWIAEATIDHSGCHVYVQGADEYLRPSRRHAWRYSCAPGDPPPPDVRLELAEALCRQVRAAMGVET